MKNFKFFELFYDLSIILILSVLRDSSPAKRAALAARASRRN